MCDLIFPSTDFIEEDKITNSNDTHISITKEISTGQQYISKYFTPLTESNLKNFFQETETFQKLDHKAIAHLQKIYFTNRSHAALLFNFNTSGNLNDLVSISSNLLSNPTILMKIMYGVASALNYLHENNLCLTNFNTSSIMLNESFEPILFDISQIKQLNKETKILEDANIQIPHENILFVAPELLIDQNNNFMNFECSEKVDVYSYGIFVYHIISGELVNSIKDESDLHSFIIFGGRPEFPPNFPEMYQELVQMCWDIDPSRRPSFKDIIDTISLNDFVLPGTDLDKYHEYIEKLKTNEKIGEIDNYKKIIEEKDNELQAASDLTDLLKTTLEESTTSYADEYEKLTKEIAHLKEQIPPKISYKDFGGNTINKEENKMKEYLIIGTCSALASFAISFGIFKLFKRK